MRYFIGIDPGKTGAWAILNQSRTVYNAGLNTEWHTFIAMLRNIKESGDDIVLACVEKAHAMPGQGTVSMFTFGEGFGIIEGTLMALDISYELVPSNRWQKAVLDVMPVKLVKRENESNTDESKRRQANRSALKDGTTHYVMRTYPYLSTVLSMKKNQGIADAVCIALYGIKRFHSLLPAQQEQPASEQPVPARPRRARSVKSVAPAAEAASEQTESDGLSRKLAL